MTTLDFWTCNCGQKSLWMYWDNTVRCMGCGCGAFIDKDQYTPYEWEPSKRESNG